MLSTNIAKIAIVILNWNGWKDTIECLSSITRLSNQDFSVIVIDNASTDTSRVKLLDWFSRNDTRLHFTGEINETDVGVYKRPFECLECVYVQASQNGGFAAGNNIGMRLALQAGCEFVWLLNNDTVVEPASLVSLKACMESDPKIGMCGSVLVYYDDRSVIQAVGGVRFNFMLGRGEQLGQGLALEDNRVTQLAMKPPTYISGASLFLSTNFLKDIGLMEESYFLYYEELDWAVRASLRWKLAIALTSVVYHKEGGSIGTASRAKRSIISQYYLNRNLIRFYALHKPWLLPIAVSRVFVDVVKLTIKKDYPMATASFSALVDGILMRSGLKVE